MQMLDPAWTAVQRLGPAWMVLQMVGPAWTREQTLGRVWTMAALRATRSYRSAWDVSRQWAKGCLRQWLQSSHCAEAETCFDEGSAERQIHGQALELDGALVRRLTATASGSKKAKNKAPGTEAFASDSEGFKWSGRQDLNLRPLGPEATMCAVQRFASVTSQCVRVGQHPGSQSIRSIQ
jgi:hypothetical protein